MGAVEGGRRLGPEAAPALVGARPAGQRFPGAALELELVQLGAAARPVGRHSGQLWFAAMGGQIVSVGVVAVAVAVAVLVALLVVVVVVAG